MQSPGEARRDFQTSGQIINGGGRLRQAKTKPRVCVRILRLSQEDLFKHKVHKGHKGKKEHKTVKSPPFVYLVSFVFKWFFKKLTHTPKPNPRAKASAKLPYGTRNTQHVFSTHLKRAQFN